MGDMGEIFNAMREANKQFKEDCFKNNLEKLDLFLKENSRFTAKTYFDNKHTHIYLDGKKLCTVYLSKQKFETVKNKFLKI
jgi:hypothetical protein